MRKYLSFIFLILASCGNGQDFAVVELNTKNGKIASVKAEVADTFEERKIGLMGKAKLLENEGMIFVWPDEGQRAFWMKDTLIPLDMIFISKDRVVAISPWAKPMDEGLISPQVDSDTVLEVNGGWVSQHQVEVGSPVSVTLVR